MSHAEIWDDSALVNSWNDALEEYKKYHSIKALGEDPEEVLSKAESGNGGLSNQANHDTTLASGSVAVDLHNTEEKGSVVEEAIIQTQDPRSTFGAPAQSDKANSGIPATLNSDSKVPALPAHLIGQVQDEGLKNLLMSWYYAGYYTGLYEGSQQQKSG